MFTGETMQMSNAQYAQDMKNGYHRNRLAIARNLLGDVRGKTVFDFGCGEGTFMRMLQSDGATVSGSEYSAELADKAPNNAAVGSVETLEPLPQNSIDVLVVLNVLGYVPAALHPRFWSAARRCIRPGGKMLQANLNNAVGSPRHYEFSTNPTEFPKTLQANGFRETRRAFHRFRLDPVSRMIFGPDIISKSALNLIPNALKAMRCTSYMSLSQASS